MKNIYYNLYHIYEIEEEEISKFIGVFSSKKEAKKAIDFLIKEPGFKDYPKKSFEIFESLIDQYGWSEGFCSWEEA